MTLKEISEEFASAFGHSAEIEGYWLSAFTEVLEEIRTLTDNTNPNIALSEINDKIKRIINL